MTDADRFDKLVAAIRKRPELLEKLPDEQKRLAQSLTAGGSGFLRGIPPYQDWLKTRFPNFTWDWQWQNYIYPYLDRITTGDCRRLILELPIRHGKSELVTNRYVAWRMISNPKLRAVVGCYSADLATTFSHDIQGMVGEEVPLNQRRKSMEMWLTSEGGMLRAVGVGGGVTGMGFNLLVVDDPIKSREEAHSEAYRNRVYGWFTVDLLSRCEPGASIIVIMSRWHEDDIVGRLKTCESAALWESVRIPAIAEEGDVLGREEGAPLCPDRYDIAALEQMRQDMGSDFYALLQARPLPPSGGTLKPEWFEVVPALPAEMSGFVRWWDKAGTKDSGDWTAGALVGLSKSGYYYIADIRRGKWSAHERENIIKQTAVEDGQDVAIWMEQEPGAAGKESAEASIRGLAGFTVHAERSTGSKVDKATPLAAQAEAGNVKVVACRWNAAFFHEIGVFPNGRHDDQVDATAGAFNKLARVGGIEYAAPIYL